jgi:hypothetical protein
MLQLIREYLSQDNRCTARPIFCTVEEYSRSFLLHSEVAQYAKKHQVSYRICSIEQWSAIHWMLHKAVHDLRNELTTEELLRAADLGIK